MKTFHLMGGGTPSLFTMAAGWEKNDSYIYTGGTRSFTLHTLLLAGCAHANFFHRIRDISHSVSYDIFFSLAFPAVALFF
jgi:NADH:ubiquinone oxidoreductase subunit H